MGDALKFPDHGESVTLDGRTAPKLMVRFRCPKCGREAVEDAYDGPVSCLVSRTAVLHDRMFMTPIAIERPVTD